MNLLLARLMDAPSLLPGRCVVCGRAYPFPHEHHPVRRSQGGTNGPRIHLCPDHHNEAHQMRLHFRYEDGWQYLETAPMKYERALDSEGWKRCG